MAEANRATHDLHYHYDGSISPLVVKHVFSKSPNLMRRALVLADQATLKTPLENPERFFERFLNVMDIFELSAGVAPLITAQLSLAKSEGLQHLDLRFGCGALSTRLGLSEDVILDGFKVAVKWAKRTGLDVCPTLCFSRYESMERAVHLAEFVCANLDFIRAIDLEGQESPNRTRDFASVFRELRATGRRITIHAGEFSSSVAIWEAIDECGAERLGHAFSAGEDPALLKRLATDQIPVEVSLTSNYLLGLCPDLKRHPFLKMLEAGVPVILCTDDRAIFQTSLSAEYEKAAVILREAGHNPATELDRIAENSRRFAFLEAGA